MSSLTAIDILILPDPAMQTKATAWNTRLRQSVPDGFALDENHTPHITLLQRYVRTDQLDDVYNVVASTIATAPVETLELTAVKLAHMQVAATPGVGLAGLLVKASPPVIDLQTALIVAIKPHTGSGGTAEAYVTSDAEPDINDDTLRYVDNYVPDHSGENYLAHVTVGQAKLDDLATLEAETFDPFTFRPAGFAVYHLGNNGTAQVQLHKWDLG
jgi:2'-5' RNA ligase superfamily